MRHFWRVSSAEHLALSEDCGIVNLSHFSIYEIAGPDHLGPERPHPLAGTGGNLADLDGRALPFAAFRPVRIAGKDVIAFRISYVGESASGKVDAGAGFGAEHRIQPARGRTGAPKVKEADFHGKAKHLEYKARLHQPAQLCTLVMTGNIDGRGAARYPVEVAARSTTPSICGCGPEPGHRFPARFVSRRASARVGVARTPRNPRIAPALFPSLIKRKPKVSRHGAAAALLRWGP